MTAWEIVGAGLAFVGGGLVGLAVSILLARWVKRRRARAFAKRMHAARRITVLVGTEARYRIGQQLDVAGRRAVIVGVRQGELEVEWL